MNKICLTFVCVFCCLTTLKAQYDASLIELKKGEAEKEKFGNVATQLFYLDDGTILELSKEMVKGDFSFRLYDSKMNLKDKFTLDVEDLLKDESTEGKIAFKFIRQIRQNIHFFYTVKSDGNIRLFSRAFDPEKRSFTRSSKEVLSKSLVKNSRKLTFEYSSSNNQKRHLITIYETRRSGLQTAFHYLLTEDLRTIKEAKFSSVSRDLVYNYLSSAVSNDGTIISNAYMVDLEADTEMGEVPFMPLDIQVLKFEETLPNTIAIDIEDQQLNDMVMRFVADETEILVAGLFKEPSKRNSSGIFIARYNVHDLSPIVESLEEYSDDLKSDMFEGYVEEDKEDPGLIAQKLAGLQQDQSGNFYFILETGTRYVSRGVSIIKIAADGYPLWDRHILRSVNGLNDYQFNANLKLFGVLGNDELHLFINQAPEFKALKTDMNTAYSGKYQTNLMHYVISDSGDRTYRELLNYEEVGNALLNCYAKNDNTYYFKTGGTIRKARLFRISFQ